MNAPLKTPLHDWHAAAGGRMVDFAGWVMPVQYSSIVEEHNAVRAGLGLFDISHMGRLEISGPQAAEFIDHVCTRRILGMKPGQIRYGLICHRHGGILDDVLVYRMPEATVSNGEATHHIVVNASNRTKIVSWFAKHSKGYDVAIRDGTQQTAMIAVQGPQAVAVMTPLLNVDLASMRYYTGQPVNACGYPCFLSRTGYTGEDGCELIVAAEYAVAVWETILGSGHAAGAKPAGLGARDTLRLEAAMPLYGHELSETINPVQAGLGFAYNLKDRSFIGSTAIKKAQSQGASLVRVGLELGERRVAREGATVLHGRVQVGEVTSGTFSPTFNRPIAMAYVSHKTNEPGVQLTVDIRGKEHAAKVVSLPFYSRPK